MRTSSKYSKIAKQRLMPIPDIDEISPNESIINLSPHDSEKHSELRRSNIEISMTNFNTNIPRGSGTSSIKSKPPSNEGKLRKMSINNGTVIDALTLCDDARMRYELNKFKSFN